jgi:hypothetical protein
MNVVARAVPTMYKERRRSWSIEDIEVCQIVRALIVKPKLDEA